MYNFEGVGEKDMYLLHHEELESLALNIPGIKRIRFFMTFGQSYLTHLKCLEDVGMTSIEPIMYEGKEIVPLQFLKAVLPDPASLGPRTVGKTNIGCIFHRQEGRQGEALLPLQHLRPPGVLQGGRLPGYQLHNRSSGDDRRGYGAYRQVEEARRLQRRGDGSGSLSWRTSISGDFRGRRISTPCWLTNHRTSHAGGRLPACVLSERREEMLEALDKSEFNAHLKNENSQKRSHKMVMKGRMSL